MKIKNRYNTAFSRNIELHRKNKPVLWFHHRKGYNSMIHLWILKLYIGFFFSEKKLIIERIK